MKNSKKTSKLELVKQQVSKLNTNELRTLKGGKDSSGTYFIDTVFIPYAPAQEEIFEDHIIM